MKQLFLIVFLFQLTLTAQNISVKSFRNLTEDVDARVHHPLKDQNGDKCAIIKVVTTQRGFKWDGDALGIVSAPYKIGEYWLYVPHGARTLSIKHEKLGVLRRYIYPIAIKEASVYELILVTSKVVTTIEEYQESTRWVVISSKPENASIFINNEYKGETTFQQELPLGKYTFRIEAPTYKTAHGIFDVTNDDERIVINNKLVPDFAKIIINSNPEGGAKVYVDGVYSNKTTPCTLEKISNGNHTIELRHKWYNPIKQTVIIKDSKNKKMDVAMISNHGFVVVKANKNTEVYMDGKILDEGEWSGKVLAGYHTFKLVRDKYYDAILKVKIKKGKEEIINLRPNPRLGEVKVISTPHLASVSINGKSYGTTPKNIKGLLIGDYVISLSKNGYGTINKHITVTEGNTFTVNEKLIEGKVIKVSTNYYNSKISIDGIVIGRGPIKSTMSFGKHEIMITRDGEVFKENIVITDSSPLTLHIDTSADLLLEDAKYYYKIGSFSYAKEKYNSFLRKYPNSYRASNAKYRLRRISKVSNQESSSFVYYHYDNVSQLGVGGGSLLKDDIGWYGVFKMGWGNMGADYSELNMMFTGGATSKLFYPLWVNYGLGFGWRAIDNYSSSDYDDWVAYEQFEIFPEIGLNYKFDGGLFLKYGLQYDLLHGSLRSQFGIGFTLNNGRW